MNKIKNRLEVILNVNLLNIDPPYIQDNKQYPQFIVYENNNAYGLGESYWVVSANIQGNLYPMFEIDKSTSIDPIVNYFEGGGKINTGFKERFPYLIHHGYKSDKEILSFLDSVK